MADVKKQVIKSLMDRVEVSKEEIRANQARVEELQEDIIKLYDCINKIRTKGVKDGKSN